MAIARALVGEPRFLLADEPTGNLDSRTASGVMELLEQVNESGTTIVMVTHDDSLAQRARRNVQILDGRIQSVNEVGGSVVMAAASATAASATI